VGYREVVAHLAGTVPRAGLQEAIERATARYAKRQETWFRHQLPAATLTLDATGDAAGVAADIAARWAARGR
jgi:tRNA dimethylallyltransferase